MGAFYYSAKAFDVLERLDPNPEYLDGKKGACVGTFQVGPDYLDAKESHVGGTFQAGSVGSQWFNSLVLHRCPGSACSIVWPGRSYLPR